MPTPKNTISAHTLSPWHVREGGKAVVGGVHCICEVNGNPRYTIPNKERLANARLIASAPELLSALKAVVTYLTLPQDEIKKHCEKVIAKAEGTI